MDNATNEFIIKYPTLSTLLLKQSINRTLYENLIWDVVVDSHIRTQKPWKPLRSSLNLEEWSVMHFFRQKYLFMCYFRIMSFMRPIAVVKRNKNGTGALWIFAQIFNNKTIITRQKYFFTVRFTWKDLPHISRNGTYVHIFSS